jgi:hypothetical protein
MYPSFQIVEPATQALLQLKATVEFFPGGYLPVFVEVQNSLRQLLENKKMAVEAVSDTLIDFFNEYEPDALKVKVEVVNNNVFFPIAVLAESGFGFAADNPNEGESEKSGEGEGGENETNGENENDDENETDGENGAEGPETE